MDPKALILESCELRDGVLYWRERPARHFISEAKADSINRQYAGKSIKLRILQTGYNCIALNGQRFTVHRVVWLLTHGEWPDSIDHINGVRTDNRIENLRNVPQPENMRNLSLSRANTSGVCGVYWYKRDGCWEAKIKAEGRSVHLGRFALKEDAIAAREEARRKYGYSETHGLSREERAGACA